LKAKGRNYPTTKESSKVSPAGTPGLTTLKVRSSALEIKAEAIKKFDEAIPYFEKIDQLLGKQGELKRADKSALKDAYDLLVTIYEQKKDKDKAAAWTDKYNNVEKVH